MSEPDSTDSAPGNEPVQLPESVRRRAVDIAADRLGALPPEDVPRALRPFAKFAPGRRRDVVLPIAMALETDETFRETVAQGLREGLPELTAAVDAGGTLPLLDPADVAAAAYLLRAPGWQDRVAAAAAEEAAARAAEEAEEARRHADRRDASSEAEVRALAGRLSEAEDRARRATDDAEREKRRAREVGERAKRAESALHELTEAIAGERAEAEKALEAAEAEVAKLRQRLAETEAALEKARRDTRESREAADTRRWLLLDTLSRAVSGLREELAPALPTRRPADLVDAAAPPDPTATMAPDDPATVDALLALPNAHLVVDGYNVTKSAYPDLTLEDQRTRLVSGLAALAARTGAEVTCVFDGADVAAPVPTAGAKKVRVRFSPPGQIADELIRRLVRAEPAGRPVTVCSADREVVDGVRRSGARVVTPGALLARLGRG
jgi:predicted RNA-binding protein with PIN domain